MRIQGLIDWLAQSSKETLVSLILHEEVDVTDTLAYRFASDLINKARSLTGPKLNFQPPADIARLHAACTQDPASHPLLALQCADLLFTASEWLGDIEIVPEPTEQLATPQWAKDKLLVMFSSPSIMHQGVEMKATVEVLMLAEAVMYAINSCLCETVE
jgi:hypothetical protein